jgi:uncharacterized protein YjbI with pentapeptide repeats
MAKQSKTAVKKAGSQKGAPKKAAPSKAAASKTDSNQGKLHSQKVAFVGKFGYDDSLLNYIKPLVLCHGAKIVEPSAAQIDYLFIGEGRGGKPPGDVAKIQKRLPTVQLLEEKDYHPLIILDRDELLREIPRKRKEKHNFWDGLKRACRLTNTVIDLTNADLNGIDFDGADLSMANFAGSDLRRAKVEYAHFTSLTGVNLESVSAAKAYFVDLEDCNFRDAQMENAWFFFDGTRIQGHRKAAMTVKQCDFTSAKLPNARIEDGNFKDCKFVGTVMTDALSRKTHFEACDFSKADLTRINANDTKFADAIFKDANLTRANFSKASLAGADLRNAKLREAVLSDADLTGANVAGADFQDAVLTGAKLDGVDFSKAKNFQPPVARKAGPKLQEFAKAVTGSKNFESKAQIVYSQTEFARLEIGCAYNGRFQAEYDYEREGKREVWDRQQYNTISQALLALADRWPKEKLRLDSITATGCKTLRGQKLLDLTIAAWAEAFGLEADTPAELAAKLTQQQATAQQERDEIVKQLRTKGKKVWEDLDFRKKREVDLRGVDFSKGKLDKVHFYNCDFKGTNFSGASLVGSEFDKSQCKQTDFSKAKLNKASLKGCVFTGAKFHQADLTAASLAEAKLQGADFTDAILTDVTFDKTQYDQTTIWPTGFQASTKLVWTGDGPAPNVAKKIIPVAKVGSLDFDTFLKDLGAKVEAARMDKAGSMLKAERFQLFAEVKDTGIVGIVKSQSGGDLVYSCRLNADGAFGCCTQNLRPCGGLRGALCKHLLVLIVGLAKAGQLDPATVNMWVDLSSSHKPAIEEDSMSATFLRYKGAESGEIDWRPTETIPEDFYAM